MTERHSPRSGPPRAVISNGFSRFHLAAAAAEADRRGILAQFVTGAYPPVLSSALASRVGGAHVGIARLLDRREAIASERISALWGPEIAYLAGRSIARISSSSVEDRTTSASVRWYGMRARQVVRARSAEVYHYRAGFGGASVAEARARGMVTLCDHSAVHPTLLEHVIEEGRLPRSVDATVRPRSRFWSWVLADIERADAVLANSDFVKRTFLDGGWPSQRIHIIYTGVDDRFLASIGGRPPRPAGGPLRLLFAGRFGRPKGADAVATALRTMDDVPWTLEIAGSIDSDMERDHASLLADPRVRLLGVVPRSRLAESMLAADVFVFPSLAEGSARVVFEALACGCYVVTTPNSGSIVEDGVHGALVPTEDAEALASALRHAAARRSFVAGVGEANSTLARARYTQHHYGAALEALYGRLVEEKAKR